MIISIVNHKGGVGKTTASVNLASALAIKKNRVLLVDLDAQAHSTYGVGIKPDIERKSIGDIMLSHSEGRFVFFYQKSIKDVIISTSRKGLYLVPSNIKLTSQVEPLYRNSLFFKQRKYAILEQCFKPILNDYEYIIIDCPPGLGVLTLNAVKACDFILVPCEISAGSVIGFNDLLNEVKEIKGESFDNYRILYTMIDPRCKSAVKYVSEQLEPFEGKLLKTRIRRNEMFNHCQIQMKDIFAFAPNSEAADNYTKLAAELTKIWGRHL